MEISIIGAGGIGSVIAAYLSRAGHQVTLAYKARSDARAVREHGLHVTGIQDFDATVNVIEWPTRIPSCDLLIVAVKTYDTREALRMAQGVPVGLILSAQNGLQKERVIAEMLGEDRVIGAVIQITGTNQGAGRLFHPSISLSFVGEMDERDSERAKSVARILTDGGIPTEASPMIRSIEWTKTCQWTATSLLSVMTGYSFPAIYSTPWLNPLLVRIVRECTEIARLDGATIVEIPGLFVLRLINSDENVSYAWLQEQGKKLEEEQGDYRASMLVDIEQRAKTEFDDIIGHVQRKSREHNIETPALDFAIRQVTQYIKSLRGVAFSGQNG